MRRTRATSTARLRGGRGWAGMAGAAGRARGSAGDAVATRAGRRGGRAWAGLVAMLVLLAACGDGEAPPKRRTEAPPVPATARECEAAAKGGLGSPGGTGLGEEINAQLRVAREEVIVRLCNEDGWPAEAARCYADARGLRELGGCRLPAPASTRLTEALQETMLRRLRLPSPGGVP